MTQEIKHDPVNHPKHYAALPAAVECIDIARHLPYPLGCAVKYVWRAGNKDQSLSGQDLDKALWYIEDYEAMLNDAYSPAPDFAVARAIWNLVTAPVDRRTMIVGYIVAGHFEVAVDCIRTLKEVLANNGQIDCQKN